jgi:Flp pilus assembly protein TadD
VRDAHQSKATTAHLEETHRGRLARGGTLGSAAVARTGNARAPAPETREPLVLLSAALARLGRIDDARSAAKAGLALNPAFTIARARALWTAYTDDPTFLTQIEPRFEGLRMAGVPEG